jgi:hypothetical protein
MRARLSEREREREGGTDGARQRDSARAPPPGRRRFLLPAPLLVPRPRRRQTEDQAVGKDERDRMMRATAARIGKCGRGATRARGRDRAGVALPEVSPEGARARAPLDKKTEQITHQEQRGAGRGREERHVARAGARGDAGGARRGGRADGRGAEGHFGCLQVCVWLSKGKWAAEGREWGLAAGRSRRRSASGVEEAGEMGEWEKRGRGERERELARHTHSPLPQRRHRHPLVIYTHTCARRPHLDRRRIHPKTRGKRGKRDQRAAVDALRSALPKKNTTRRDPPTRVHQSIERPVRRHVRQDLLHRRLHPAVPIPPFRAVIFQRGHESERLVGGLGGQVHQQDGLVVVEPCVGEQAGFGFAVGGGGGGGGDCGGCWGGGGEWGGGG